MLDVFVLLPNEEEWTFVTCTPNTVDIGEIVVACQVLYPNMIGVCVEPMTEETNEG